MSWNYRVIQQKCEATGDPYFGIHEVYYNIGDDDSTITAISTKAIAPFGDETMRQLEDDIGKMVASLEKPVLIYDEITFVEQT